MKVHWDNVVKVFEALSYIVKEAGSNGFDLWFTGPGNPMKRCKNTSGPLQDVERRKQQGTTDIKLKLGRILEDYVDEFKKSQSSKRILLNILSKPLKPLSLYVLTDGIWEPECDPAPLIRSFVLQLVDLRKLQSQVGVQFISFGKDPIGRKRMEQLDLSLDASL